MTVYKVRRMFIAPTWSEEKEHEGIGSLMDQDIGRYYELFRIIPINKEEKFFYFKRKNISEQNENTIELKKINNRKKEKIEFLTDLEKDNSIYKKESISKKWTENKQQDKLDMKLIKLKINKALKNNDMERVSELAEVLINSNEPKYQKRGKELLKLIKK